MKSNRNEVKKLELFAGGVLLVLTFLLPLKFGSLAVMPEASSFYPDSIWGYLLVNWPAPGFGFFAGAALLAALIGFPASQDEFRSAAGRSALLWGPGIVLVSLIGWIHAQTLDYAVCETGHLAGIGAYVFAVYLMLARRPQWRGIWISSLVAGTLLVGVYGLHQYFIGFEETRRFIARQKEEGIPISRVLEIKAADTRVFSTFVSCNALGGFLLLLLPVALMACRRWAGYFEPVKWSIRLFVGCGAVLLVPVFLLTKSRGAFLAALLTGVLYVFLLPMRRIWRTLLIAAAVVVIIGGAVYIHQRGRGFGSMEERVDYLKTAATMTLEQPLTGHGWGGFFFRHMHEKSSDSDEAAHDPHNFCAAFASQAGVVAFMVVLAAVLLPMTLLGKRVLQRRATAIEQAIFWGECGFFLHALMDIDLQIPASMAAAGGLLIAALSRPEALDAPQPAAQEKKMTPPAERGVRKFLPPVVPLLLAVTAMAFSRHLVQADRAFDVLQNLVNGSSIVNGREERRPASGDQVYAAMQQVVEIKPYSPFPWETAAGFYLRRGDGGTAERLLNEAEKRGGERASIHYKLFQIELQRGNFPAALAHWRRIFELFPTASYREEIQKLDPELYQQLENAPLLPLRRQ